MSEKKKTTPAAKPQIIEGVALRSEARTLPLPAGLFLFAVRDARPEGVGPDKDLMFPALHVAPGPGCPAGLVEFVGSKKSIGAWLFRLGDQLVVKVEEPGANLVLNSIRAEGSVQPLDVTVVPIDGASREAAMQVAKAAAALQNQEQPGNSGGTLTLQLELHIRNYGDLSFSGSEWAGMLAENLWIEAISISLKDGLSSGDIEYKSLSSGGFESPWLTDGAVSGTKGRGTPLIGFAIRLRPDAASRYDCEYSGFFQSGTTMGPVRNGVPCRSRTAADPLVGIKLLITERATTAQAAQQEVKAAPKEVEAVVASGRGPRFGKFRADTTAPAAPVKGKKPTTRAK